MFVAGIDAHATYSVIAIVSNTGQLVHGPVRIHNKEADRLDELLSQYRPLEVVVETSPAWPWLFDRLQERGIHFVLAHAKRIRVMALVHGSGLRTDPPPIPRRAGHATR